jgi:hypothetical protein
MTAKSGAISESKAAGVDGASAACLLFGRCARVGRAGHGPCSEPRRDGGARDGDTGRHECRPGASGDVEEPSAEEEAVVDKQHYRRGGDMSANFPRPS